MKIKSKEQIFHCVNDSINIPTWWVAVDGVKEWLLNEIHRAGAPAQMFREFEKSLSTSQSEGTELKFKVPSPKEMIKGLDKLCPHCNMDISIRNPSGYCDHLYYPEYCKVCKEREGKARL